MSSFIFVLFCLFVPGIFTAPINRFFAGGYRFFRSFLERKEPKEL